MKFDLEYQEAMKGSLKRKGSRREKEATEENQSGDTCKGEDLRNKDVEDLSEEEGVGAIQKWLEENSCPWDAGWCK